MIAFVCRVFVLGGINKSHDEDHAMLVEGPPNNRHRNLEGLTAGLAVTFRVAFNPHAIHDLKKRRVFSAVEHRVVFSILRTSLRPDF